MTSCTAPRSPFPLTGDGLSSHHPRRLQSYAQQRSLPRAWGRCRACEADEVHDLTRVHLSSTMPCLILTVSLRCLTMIEKADHCDGRYMSLQSVI